MKPTASTQKTERWWPQSAAQSALGTGDSSSPAHPHTYLHTLSPSLSLSSSLTRVLKVQLPALRNTTRRTSREGTARRLPIACAEKSLSLTLFGARPKRPKRGPNTWQNAWQNVATKQLAVFLSELGTWLLACKQGTEHHQNMRLTFRAESSQIQAGSVTPSTTIMSIEPPLLRTRPAPFPALPNCNPPFLEDLPE